MRAVTAILFVSLALSASALVRQSDSVADSALAPNAPQESLVEEKSNAKSCARNSAQQISSQSLSAPVAQALSSGPQSAASAASLGSASGSAQPAAAEACTTEAGDTIVMNNNNEIKKLEVKGGGGGLSDDFLDDVVASSGSTRSGRRKSGSASSGSSSGSPLASASSPTVSGTSSLSSVSSGSGSGSNLVPVPVPAPLMVPTPTPVLTPTILPVRIPIAAVPGGSSGSSSRSGSSSGSLPADPTMMGSGTAASQLQAPLSSVSSQSSASKLAPMSSGSGSRAKSGIPLGVRREFEAHVHFAAGYDREEVFDFGGASSDAPNPNNYKDEYKNFPDAWATLVAKVKTAGSAIQGPITLSIAGVSRLHREAQKHVALSERRASSVACYVADWLKANGVKDFTLRVGIYGDMRLSGATAAALAHDRRVDIFFPAKRLKNSRFCPRFILRSGAPALKKGEGGLQQYCASKNRWQTPNFADSWMSYAGTAGSAFPANAANRQFAVTRPRPQVQGTCSMKGVQGACMSGSSCTSTSFTAAEGATGCEKFSADTKCCVVSCQFL